MVLHLSDLFAKLRLIPFNQNSLLPGNSLSDVRKLGRIRRICLEEVENRNGTRGCDARKTGYADLTHREASGPLGSRGTRPRHTCPEVWICAALQVIHHPGARGRQAPHGYLSSKNRVKG